MNRKTIVLCFLLILPIANAQFITIGVSPSVVSLRGKGEAKLTISFYNTYGEVDANYTIEPDECMIEYLKEYPKSFIVPKGSSVLKEFKLAGNFNVGKTCYVYVYGRPVNVDYEKSTINVRHRVGIKFMLNPNIHTVKETTTTTFHHAGSGSSRKAEKVTTTTSHHDDIPSRNFTITTTTRALKTTTTEKEIKIEEQAVKSSVSVKSLKPLILYSSALCLFGVGYVVARKLEKKGIIILPFVLMMLSYAYAQDVDVSVDICPSCPQGYYLETGYPECKCSPLPQAPHVRAIIGLLPLLVATSLIILIMKSIFYININRMIALTITILISVVLIALLISLV